MTDKWNKTWSTDFDVPHNTGNVPDYDDTQWPDYDESPQEQPKPKVEENQSPHCAYCLCDVPQCLVKCQKTGKYFCNGAGKNGISHIVYHLVKAHLKQIELPEQNPYSKVPLVCYVCGQSNIFNLSFAQSYLGNFFIVCRECVNTPTLAPFQLDTSKMQNLVTDKSILHWLVRPPTRAEAQTFFSMITPQDMNLLEEQWTQNPNASIVDLPQIKAEAKIPETRLQYSRERQYVRVYHDLVKLEEAYDQQCTEAYIVPNIPVEWIKGFGQNWDARFVFPPAENSNLINFGDDIFLTSDDFQQRGTINSISADDRVTAHFKFNGNPPNSKYSVRLVFKRLPYLRMYDALKSFALGSRPVSREITEIILGKTGKINQIDTKIKSQDVIRINGLPPLNESQTNAINQASTHHFTIIQGPPGTGKTTTIAALVAHLLNNRQGPILVCAPSNIAADHVTYSIAHTNVNVVRVSSWSRDGYQTIVDQFNVSNLAFALDTSDSHRLHQIMQQRATGEITQQLEDEYQKLRTRLETQIIERSDVVVSTCVTSGDQRLKNMKFPVVIIDEATQALEPQILIAAQHNTTKLILVGDHCQLGPVVLCKKAASAGLEASMVQRLVQLGVKPVRLLTQYRMHPALAEFSSNYFYEGTLQNGVSSRERTPERAKFPWPNPDYPMFFYSTAGEEQLSETGTSYVNQFEAIVASQVISKLCKAGVSPNQIGIITPYAGQRLYLKQLLPATGDLPPEFYSSITIASVDSFQGSEHDYIILSCVRSNRIGTIGFLKDRRRLNVAISRARCGLIVIGCAKCLAHNSLWYSFIKHFQEKQLLFEGQDINHLYPARIILQPPGKQKEEGEIGVPRANSGSGMVPELNTAEDFDINDSSYF